MSVLQPFPRPVGDVGLGAFSAEAPTVTLQDLMQLDVRVTWDEAVSVVEELCVAAQGLVMRPIPAASDIVLNANGTVAIGQSAGGAPDPVEAARRLAELLAGSVAPAPLRLFVSQAVSSGSYNSLAEFSDALAYYAKPGRQERVKAVYQRASEQLMLQPQSATETPRPKAAAITKPESATPSRLQQSWRQLALIGLTTAAGVSIVFGVGLYLWPSASSAPSAPLETETEAVAATPTDAAAAPARRPARVASSRQAPTARTSSALDAARIPLTGSRAASGYAGGSGGFRQGTGTSAGAPRSASTSVAAASAGGAEPAAQVTPQTQPTESNTPAALGVPAPASSSPIPIYSASDATVQPAVLARPQLLPSPLGPGDSGKPIRLELVISPTGTVERARFLETPQRMADMMLLSSAKTWQFTPAVKDGQPVRYRTVLSWVGAP